MQVEVLLEPAGQEAVAVLDQWRRGLGLELNDQGRVEISSELCLEVLAELRARCYDDDLVVNATFTGQQD